MTSLSFKSLIDEALEINNMSINKLATIIGVDRPWLQHALVGRRNLGYDNFEKIMSVLNIPEHLNNDLREAFAREHFGESNFSIIAELLSKLNTMAEYENSSTPPYFLTIQIVFQQIQTSPDLSLMKNNQVFIQHYLILLKRNYLIKNLGSTQPTHLILNASE